MPALRRSGQLGGIRQVSGAGRAAPPHALRQLRQALAGNHRTGTAL
jgi:hypothetical protein